METRIPRDGQLATLIAELVAIPRDRIQHWVILVQHDQGVAVLHTLCCMAHVKEGLARISVHPPDLEVPRFEGDQN